MRRLLALAIGRPWFFFPERRGFSRAAPGSADASGAAETTIKLGCIQYFDTAEFCETPWA